jgi:hypothetical protein
MMCGTVCHTLDKWTEKVTVEGPGALDHTELYHSLQIFVMQVGNVFGRPIFVQELFNLGVCVFLFYGVMTEREVIYLTAFFLTNGVALTVRIYLLYLPMVNVYSKSLKFKEVVARKLIESKLLVDGARVGSWVLDDRKILQRKAAAFRHMVFRPAGLHQITPTSISDYVIAMFSNVVTLKARWP